MTNNKKHFIFIKAILFFIIQTALFAQSNIFHSLTVEKNPVKADGADIQRVYLNFTKQDEVEIEIERLSICVNYLDDGSNPERGAISWYAATGFVKETGYGGEFIELADAECSRVIDGARITFTFAWKLKLNYGDIQANDIAYDYEEFDDNYASGWVNHDTNFNVLVDAPAELTTLEYGKFVVFTGETDVQTITLHITDDTPQGVTFAGIRINYQDDSNNPDRGYLSWQPGSGFVKESGYGSEYINLVSAQCQSVISGNNITITFAFNLKSAYGVIADNDVSSYIEEYDGERASGWVNHDIDFDAVDFLAFTITEDTQIGAADFSFDNAHLTVNAGITLVIAGTHSFNTLVLEQEAALLISSPADITLNLLELNSLSNAGWLAGSSGSVFRAGMIKLDGNADFQADQDGLAVECMQLILDHESAMVIGGINTAFHAGIITLAGASTLVSRVTDNTVTVDELNLESAATVSLASNQIMIVGSPLAVKQGAALNLEEQACLEVKGDITVEEESALSCTDQSRLFVE